MVSWDVISRQTKQKGLGVLYVQNINTVALTKWVARIMGPRDDLTISILWDNYCKGLNREPIGPSKGGVTILARHVIDLFLHVHDLFKAKLGDDSTFQYWLDAWSPRGTLREVFPLTFCAYMTPYQYRWRMLGWNVESDIQWWYVRLEGCRVFCACSNPYCISDQLAKYEMARNRKMPCLQSVRHILRSKGDKGGARTTNRAYRIIWRQKISLKEKIFRWLLLRRRLVPFCSFTCAFCSHDLGHPRATINRCYLPDDYLGLIRAIWF